MASRYWVGNSGNWLDTTHWSTTSGGSGGAAAPTSTDDVYLDANSFSANGTINLVVAGGDYQTVFNCASFDSSGLTQNVTIGLSGSTQYLIVTGSFKASNKLTYSAYFLRIYVPASFNAILQPNGAAFTYNGGDVRFDAITAGSGTIKIYDITTNGLYGQKPLSSVDLSNATLTVKSFALSSYYGVTQSSNFTNTTINLGSSGSATSAIYIDQYNSTNMTGSTINVVNNGSDTAGNYAYIYSNDPQSLNNLNIASGSKIHLASNSYGNWGNLNYNAVTIGGNSTVYFGQGTSHTFNSLTLTGTSGNLISMRSTSTSGGKYTLTKFSGTVSASYIDVKDSTVNGGATWNATSSVDSGNNTGWNFIGPQVPVADFTASTYTPYTSASVSFTDSSANVPTSWAWNFGDGGTSTSQNTTHAYATPGSYTVTLVATNSVGSNTKTKYITVTTKVFTNSGYDSAGPGGESLMTFEYDHIDVLSQVNGGGVAQTRTVFQALAEKTYEYRVYTHTNNYISTWTNVTSDFGYDQSINQNASEITVSLARSPDNRTVKIDALKDASSAVITDENSDPILVQTSTANSVGPDTDVDINLNVDVYVFYGGYDSLQDENGNDILDSNSEQIIVQFGFPNGKRVYSGYIADYDLTYGDSTGVQALVVPHATELSHYVFKDGSGNTTVSYGSTVDPVKMARDAMDNYISQGGRIGYSVTTMPLSGETNPYDFKLQTPREVLDKTIELLPSNFYSYTDPGDNMAYILQKGLTAKHTFYYEKHINKLVLKRSITQLVNDVYYVGGTKPDTTILFRHAYDSTSISSYRKGLDRLTDGRVTVDASADALSQGEIDQYKMPRYRTSVTIYDTRYDIESIKLGEMVGFKNFDNFADSLLLQIVSIHRSKHSVTLDLDMIVPTDVKRLYELKKELQANAFAGIAVAPSI